MVDVNLSRVVLYEGANRQYIYLREAEGERSFAIVIGTTEAYEIARVIRSDPPKRPLTHELLYRTIQAVGSEVIGVDIVRLERDTYYASLRVRPDGGEPVEIDARPSDAIAIALRARCPLRVARAVIDAAATD
ncbi:hypothetical protein Pla86_43610 [Planctomycetes bacterium Pla86]|uniref:BFN domain-containing protein n=2 Tax=Engelhardtia mirabilis TaxID=2528011 RepID=A0A518BQJ0_9BACT|nr:hypothetical protein Pla133_43620 [Planctomycetes bacterium Pla133]QDV03572.1 hypothetical protein Pla86_43610 [Planctomycetes bacterium Pla86]